jgi:DNA modification methylase
MPRLPQDVGLTCPTLKPKDLVGIPWRVAFALQADGWYLRSDIIWAKPNPMPESVTDRPTKSHEYVFLLSKGARYFYDAVAIAENSIRAGCIPLGSRKINETPHADGKHEQFGKARLAPVPDTRNARTVWTIPTQPTPDAHFATFPEALAERCILAGSAPGDAILDPFFGSGTVGKVAERLGRKWTGIELNPAYVGISERKTAQRGLFASGAE